MNTPAANPAHLPAHAQDWRTLDLQPGGRSLIEASAGTGKTWTIAALYLRLLLERALTPRQIVVTTFTDAAASELRERLRTRLYAAEAWARAGIDAREADTPARDGVEAWLRARWTETPALRDPDLQRLRLALAELDLAPVGTLHGLCARILREHPFAAGRGFEPDALVDGSALLEELAIDLKRVLRQGDADAIAAWLPRELHPLLASERIDHAALASLLKPGIDIRAGDAPVLPADAAVVLRAGAREGMFKAKSALPRAWNAVAERIEAGDLAAIDPEHLKSLRLPKALAGLLKPNLSDPDVLRAAELSPRLADVLQAGFDQRRLRFWQHLRDWVLAHKQAWMQRHAQRSFDDLLLDVHAALLGASAGDSRALADTLCAAWPVALVDEFQDTDGLQYGILDAIYRDAAGRPRGRLVMIGDPKQAIYRFRGGDIHTYQQAAAAAEDRLQLAVNQRSSRAYVEALNQFHAVAGAALDAADAGAAASSGIRYQAVAASGRRDGEVFAIAGSADPQPLHVHYCADPPPQQPARVEAALRACANDIAAMLAAATHAIGDLPLQPQHIAVLLPTGRQVQRLRQLLEARGVPCVTQARDSVFDGETARDLQLLLHGVWHAQWLPAVRAALLTPLIGVSFAQLLALQADAVALQRHVADFHGWRALWQRRGVMALVDALIAAHGARWLQGDNGERRLTDLRHLGESLQAQADAGLGAAELIDWLAAQRSGQSDDGEQARDSRQLRIESEAPRVRLMTLHASKGLEFPIVFLPLMWAHGERDEAGLSVLHDAASGRRLLQPGEAAREQVRRELQDERFRVLYVALTRAIHACHVYALPPDRPQNAKKGAKPVDATGTARSALDVMLARMPHPPLSMQLDALTPGIAWRAGWNSAGQVSLPAPVIAAPSRLLRDPPADAPLPLPSRHSFSTLTRGVLADDGSQADAADDEATLAVAESALRDDALRDAASTGATSLDAASDRHTSNTIAASLADTTAEHPALHALAVLRGIGIGNALHAVLERRDVGLPLAQQPALLRRALIDEGLWPDAREGLRLASLLAARLDAALATPLAADMPALASIDAGDQRAEMEFHFALGRTSLAALREACTRHGEPRLVPPGERVLAGLMTGKIDLLFAHAGRVHVLDWKGNFLGTRLEDYRDAALERAMHHAHYRFQALLYVIALERHLRLRIPGYRRERHLGDAWYLFLRAAGLAPGAGIWRHRFDDALLGAVDAALPAPALETAA